MARKEKGDRVIFSSWTHDFCDDLEKYKEDWAKEEGLPLGDTERAGWSDEDWWDDIYDLIRSYQDDMWDELEAYMDKQDTESYVLTGTLGLWHGSPQGFKQVNSVDELKSAVWGRSIEDIKILQQGPKVIFYMYHHDGTNIMELRRITARGQKILDNNPYDDILSYFSEDGLKFIKNYTKNFGDFHKDVYGS